VKVDIARSKVLEVRVLNSGVAFWRNAEDPWARTQIKDLVTVFKPYKSDKDKVVIIRIDRDAKFSNMVDVIDELDLASLTRFSLQTLEDKERSEVEGL
jgi:biopolymer transport protein ExbD